MEKPIQWNDEKNLRQRAWESVREFLGKEEEPHPMSPEEVEELRSKPASPKPYRTPEEEEEGIRAERIHRETEQRALNDRPNIWPG
jgi:hypothetical protein